MSIAGRFQQFVTLAGLNLRQDVTVASDAAISSEELVPAATACQLTTRATSGVAGTLTFLSTGHGLTTGARFALFWNGGMAYATVGTVPTAMLIIPFTVASATLPANLSAITAAPFTSLVIPCIAAKLQSLTLSSDVLGIFNLRSSGALIASLQPALGVIYSWFANCGNSNPLGSTTLATIEVAHGSTTAQKMRVALQYNN